MRASKSKLAKAPCQTLSDIADISPHEGAKKTRLHDAHDTSFRIQSSRTVNFKILEAEALNPSCPNLPREPDPTAKPWSLNPKP